MPISTSQIRTATFARNIYAALGLVAMPWGNHISQQNHEEIDASTMRPAASALARTTMEA